MPDIRRVTAQAAIGGSQAIEVTGPESLTTVSVVTLTATLADGTTLTRPFAGERDAFQDRSSTDHGSGTQSHTSVLDSGDGVLDEPLESDVVLAEERGPNRFDDEPYPLTAVLGDGLNLDELCENLMPTRLQVAERAVEAAGFALVVHEGPGLPFLEEQVDREYRTVGKSARTILQDMLLETQPRVWYTSSTVHVDGRVLPAGGSLLGTYSTHDRSYERGASVDEPIAPIAAAERATNYELADNYTLEWQEEAGEEYTRTVTTYRIEKVGGQVAEEHVSQHGFLRRGEPGATYYSWETLYESSAWHEYHELSSKALVHSLEVVRVANAITAHWDGPAFTREEEVAEKIEDLHTVISDLYGMVETRRHEVWQTWHAEGWLRSKAEDTTEPSGWVVTDADTQAGAFLKRRLTRREVYTPIGAGIWNVQTTDTITTEKPVYEPINPAAVEGDADYGVTFYSYAYPVENSTTQHVVTDQAPPSVTINPDPCDERTDFEIEMDQYDREVQVRDAILSNNPDKQIDTYTIPGLAFQFEVGRPAGGALVASVEHAVDVDGGAASTTVTLWGRHES